MLRVIFDVETKKAFDEVGGYHPERLGVSLVGAWKGEEEGEGEFLTYREGELGEFFQLLEKAEVVVGFNILGFDYPVLSPYYSGDFENLPSLDMLERVEKSVGYRVSLDDLVKESLGVQKTGHGLDAIKYYHEGDWESLEKYCLQDVKVTKDLYFYGLREGKVVFKNKWNRLVEAEVDFELGKEGGKQVQRTMF